MTLVCCLPKLSAEIITSTQLYNFQLEKKDTTLKTWIIILTIQSSFLKLCVKTADNTYHYPTKTLKPRPVPTPITVPPPHNSLVPHLTQTTGPTVSATPILVTGSAISIIQKGFINDCYKVNAIDQCTGENHDSVMGFAQTVEPRVLLSKEPTSFLLPKKPD